MGQTNTVVMATGFQSITHFNWDVVPLPKGPAGRYPFLNAIGWFVFSSSKHKSETLEFLRFLTSNEALTRRVEVTGLVPPSMRVFQSVWLPNRMQPASRHLLQEDFDQARSPFRTPAEYFSIINRQILAAIWGDVAPASAIEQMESQIEGLIRTRQ